MDDTPEKNTTPPDEPEFETPKTNELMDKIKALLKDKRVIVAGIAFLIIAPLLIALIALNGSDDSNSSDTPSLQDNDGTITVEINSLDELESLVTELEELQSKQSSELDQLDQLAE